MIKRPKRVCIFGSQIATALKGNTIGGAELQMAMIAKTLADNGTEVIVIDREANEAYEFRKNIRIEGVPGWESGVRGLRFFTHRVPNFFRSLKKTGASVFYVRGCSYLYLVPLCAAKYSNAKFVMAISHDSELWSFRERYNVFYKNNSSFWDWISTNLPNEIAIFFLLKFCDILLVQHEHQVELARWRGRESILLPNIIDDDVENIKSGEHRKSIVVVGALSNRKGLNVLLPVIINLRQIVFEFIGGAEDLEGFRIRDKLREYPNVVLHGWLDRKHTLEKIAGAKALVNTSTMEGFPNVFIEAWALGTPVISLYVDPGGLIKTHKLGYVCGGDIGTMEELLQKDKFDLDSERIRGYALRRHSKKYAESVFEDILSTIGDQG